ncbi:MAG: fused MFS/spermidine synthase [Zoogloea sp.]|nr:fused MFS/spermidine synthase [Zoogloea sp.]
MSLPIDISEEAGVRYLHFGSEWVQGAMRIRKPHALELAYTREMMAGLLMRPAPWPRNALLIGLGAGSLTRFIHHHLPHTRITVVEIAPEVLAVAQQYFKLPEQDARLRIVIGDGADFVLSDTKRWDAILLDGFDRHARAGALDTVPFYQACRARLSDNGVLTTNMFGSHRGFKASLERLTKAFDGRALALPACDSGNVIGVATAGDAIDWSLAELQERADALKAATGLDLRATVGRLEASRGLSGGRLVI